MPGNCFTVLCIDTDQRPQESTATNTPPPPSLRPDTTIPHGSDAVPRPSEISSPTRPAVSEKDLGGIDGPRDKHAERIQDLLFNIYKQPAEPPVPVAPTPEEPHGTDSPSVSEEPEGGYDAPSSPGGMLPPPAPPVAPNVSSVSPAVGPSVPRAPRINVSAAWEEIGRLGAGSFGTVFKARCLKTGTIFAVKKVPFSKEEQLTGKVKACVMALEKEMRVLRQLWHPNVVQYIRTQRTPDALNILLEYVSGGSIASNLAKNGPMEEGRVKVYVKQLLKGLHYLHEKNIMHRDIKGANILVTDEGVCKLADFGASKFVEDLASVGGNTVAGTPFWMAPEIVKQHGHGRPADIWSLGCCVIEMATAKPPCFDRFSSNPLAFLMWVSNELNTPELPPNEQLRGEWSPEARSFLTRCFHRTPNKRAHAMELMMHPWLVGVVTPTPTAPPVAAAAAQPAVPAVPVPSAPQGPVAVPAVLAPGRQAGAAGVAGASEVVTVDTKAAPQAAVQASVRASVQASIRASVNSRPAPVAGTGAAPVATLPEHSGKSLQPRQPQQGAAEGGRVAIVATSADPSGPQQSLQTGPQPANDREQQESDDWQSGDVGVTATASSLAKLQLGPGRQVEERAGQLPGGFLSGWGEEDEGVHDMVNFGTVMHAGGADTLVNLGSVMMAGEADGRDGAHVRAMGSVAQDAPGVEGVEDGLGMATWASSAMAGSMYNTMFNPMQEPTLMESGAQAEPFVEVLRRALPNPPPQQQPAQHSPPASAPAVQAASPPQPQPLPLPPRPASRSPGAAQGNPAAVGQVEVQGVLAAAAAVEQVAHEPEDSVVVVRAGRTPAAASKVLDGGGAAVSTPDKHRLWEEQLQREIDSARQGQRASMAAHRYSQQH